MSKLIGIMGDTGRGKTLSFVVPTHGVLKKEIYEGMNPWETMYFSYDKELPFYTYVQRFPAWKKAFTKELEKDGKKVLLDWFETNVRRQSLTKSIKTIKKIALNPKIKNICLDTLSIAMNDERMSREKEKGFDKWSDLGLKVYELMKYLRDLDRPDLFVWWFSHIEFERNREGEIEYKSKIEGNMLDKKLEEWTVNIFLSVKKENKHFFETQSNNSSAKNPPLLFDEVIPNSMKLINDVLRNQL